MAAERSWHSDLPQRSHLESQDYRTASSNRRELTKTPKNQLREALGREEVPLRRKDDLIQKLELLGREADHRLLNGMQMIVSLLSMQGRLRSMPRRPGNWRSRLIVSR